MGAEKLLYGLVWHWLIVATGSLLILFSAFCFVAGVWRNLNPGTPPPDPDAKQLPRFLLIAINGFLTLVAIATLVGIWFGRDGPG